VSLRALSVLPALLLALLTACEAIEPISLEVQFEPMYTRQEGGVCDVEFVARASGIGAATWERVVIRRNGQVVSEYAGGAVADFWGATRIQAGQTQVSVPVRMSTDTPDMQATVYFRMGGPERTYELQADCRQP
jgi:hypothetical protein